MNAGNDPNAGNNAGDDLNAVYNPNTVNDPNAANNADDMGIDINADENAIEAILKEELILTKNPNNLFDLNTSYGQYATI
jgi:hypothetical protein